MSSISKWCKMTQTEVVTIGVLLDFVPNYGHRILLGSIKSSKRGEVLIGSEVKELSDTFSLNYDIFRRTLNFDFKNGISKDDRLKLDQIQELKKTGLIPQTEIDEMEKIVNESSSFVDSEVPNFTGTIEMIGDEIFSADFIESIRGADEVYIIPYGEIQSVPLELLLNKKLKEKFEEPIVARDLSLQSLLVRLINSESISTDNGNSIKYFLVDIEADQQETFEEEVDFIVICWMTPRVILDCRKTKQQNQKSLKI